MPSKLGWTTGFEPARLVVECAMGSTRRRWRDKEFVAAVKRNITISGVLRDLGISDHGGNYREFHRHVARLGVPTDHMKGRGHGQSRAAIPLEDILVRNSSYGGGSSALRRRLLRAGLLEETCAECGGGTHWHGKTLQLQLDHINGDPRDNRLENLRLLCPNCHSQTLTFSGKNRKTERPQCLECSHEVWGRSLRCVGCENARRVGRKTKIEWPPLEELEEALASSNFEQVARDLAVSSNAIRNHIRRLHQMG